MHVLYGWQAVRRLASLLSGGADIVELPTDSDVGKIASRWTALLRPDTMCLSSLDLVGDSFTVANDTNSDVVMTGWTVQSETYDSKHGWTGTQTFRFPDDYTLESGSKLTVWSGRATDHDDDVFGLFRGRVCKGAETTNGVWTDQKQEGQDSGMAHCYWTGRYMWNNDGDVAALRDADGVLVDRLLASAVEMQADGSHDIGVQPTETAIVRISKLELQQERVKVWNSGDMTVDMSGWTMNSLTGSQQFAFPDGFSLEAGEAVDVVSGPTWDVDDSSPSSGGLQKRLLWSKRRM